MNRIREIRRAKGVSLTQLTVATDIPTATLHRYETGNIPRVPLDVARAIANALAVPLDELFPPAEVSA